MHNEKRDILVADTQKDLNKINILINDILPEREEYWKKEYIFIDIFKIMANMNERFLKYAWENDEIKI